MPIGSRISRFFGGPIGCRWRCIGQASTFRGSSSSRWLIRSAGESICANLAEGFGRQQLSKPEFRRFLIMALGSADEMQVWAMYCRDLGYVESDVVERGQGEYREIARMLSALCRSGSDN